LPAIKIIIPAYTKITTPINPTFPVFLKITVSHDCLALQLMIGLHNDKSGKQRKHYVKNKIGASIFKYKFSNG